MASRTASTTHRSASSSSHRPAHNHTSTISQTQTTAPSTNRRQLLHHQLSRRPPPNPSLRARTARSTTQDPTPSRASRQPTITSLEGTTDEQDEEHDSDSDIIIVRPQSHPQDLYGHAYLDLGAHANEIDPNAQAMAQALKMQRELPIDTTASMPEATVAELQQGHAEEEVMARLIELYRRRERDQERVDQEELKGLLWDSLRRKVKTLDEDRWMFEVEDVGYEGV